MLQIPKKLIPKLEKFSNEYPDIVSSFYFKKIKRAIKNKEDRVAFYRIKNTNIVAGVKDHDYIETLEQLLDTFIKVENYENAKECKLLIEQLQTEKIDRLIKESNEL